MNHKQPNKDVYAIHHEVIRGLLPFLCHEFWILGGSEIEKRETGSTESGQVLDPDITE
jgi:hypothetical protein